MLMVGSGALFQPLIGALLDAGWEGSMAAGARIYPDDVFRGALWVLPAASLVGVLAAALLTETHCRQGGQRGSTP